MGFLLAQSVSAFGFDGHLTTVHSRGQLQMGAISNYHGDYQSLIIKSENIGTLMLL